MQISLEAEDGGTLTQELVVSSLNVCTGEVAIGRNYQSVRVDLLAKVQDLRFHQCGT